MKNVSNQFRNELFNGNRNFIKSADIKLKDETVLHVDNSKLWQNGLKIEDSVSNSSSFDIGSAIIGQLTVTLNNIYDEYSNYDFTNAEISNIKVGLKLPDDTIESLSYGIYTVNETKYNGSFITLTAYDNLYKFDVSYSKSTLSYPATLGEIVRDACSVCNVQLGTASFDNDDFLVNERPSDDSITFRNVLLWVAQISCKFLKVDAYGKLLLSWYNTGIFESIKIISGGKFRPWETDVAYDGGSFSPWTEGDITIDGGNFSDGNFHNIYNWSSFPNITTDDVIITGIKVTDEVETDDGKEEVTYQSGEEGYILSIEDNKLIQGKGEIVCNYLGEKLIGLTFRPFSGNCLSDPTVEAGDLAIISDRKGNSYKTFITSNTFQPGNFQSLSCNAETPLRNSVSRFSKLTQALVDNRKEIQKQKTEWQKAMEDLSNRINNSSGLYMTSEEQPDGSSIYYMHDKPTLEESMIVWKMTAEAVAVSTDGGKTYNAGLTVDGTLIAKIMNTIGINFDWGVGGSLIIKDKKNAETFYVDAETGIVRIVADSFTLRGKTIEEITSDQLNDFNDSELNQQGIFNRLTNNGDAQGFFLRDGQLYLNGQYMEFNGATIGGWLINNNQLINNQTGFTVRIQAPSIYGTVGLGTSDIISVHDTSKDTWPFVVTSDGSVDIGTDFYYRPNGFTYDSTVQLNVGGWQIKHNQNVWDYDEVIYWDTAETQTNGIGAKGPWVIWGGWNGGASINVDNYKFVVTDQGVCKAMSWVTGSRLEWKENIVPYSKSAVQEIMNSDVYYYDLKNQSKSAWQEGRHIGFIIGDGYNVSADILDGGGGAIDMYSALAIAYKAIQELQTEIQTIKQKIES